jgi:hypothetical protein
MCRKHKKGEKHNLAWQQMAAQERILIESKTKKLLTWFDPGWVTLGQIA